MKLFSGKDAYSDQPKQSERPASVSQGDAGGSFSRRPSGPSSSDVPAPDDSQARETILAGFRDLIHSEKFRHYAGYEGEIATAMMDVLPALVSKLERSRLELRRAQRELKQSRSPIKRLRRALDGEGNPKAVLSAAVSVFVASLTLRIALLWKNQTLLDYFVIALILVAVWYLVVLGFRSPARKSEEQLKVELLTVQFEQLLNALVEEGLTQASNKVLGPMGRLAFPTHAPRLVELDNSVLVSSNSLRLLRDFIGGHSTSAVGIAGPRGIGKSTLMRAISEDQSLKPFFVAITAPTRYDPSDFTRRLYLEVALLIYELSGGTVDRSGVRRVLRPVKTRLLVASSAMVVGALMIVVDTFRPAIFTEMHFGTMSIFGGTIAAFGLVLCVLAVSALPPKTPNPDTSAQLAQDAIRALTFEAESTGKSKNKFNLFGEYLSLEDEESLKLKSRALSQADMIKELRVLLRAFGNDQRPNRVIIGVDELDKISETNDLIEIVNGLKDLFHIDGVHFIVSVSTDALSNFERRGLPSRDAFDSAFDVIVRVQPLRLTESLDLLAARAEGFPPILGAFCHAWSGGVPRDLLRIARRCVEIQRDAPNPLPISSFVRMVVVEDLMAIVEGQLNSPDISLHDKERLWSVRGRVERLRKSGADSEASGELDQSLSSTHSVALLGEALIGYFAESHVTSRNWSKVDGVVERSFEAAAHAMSRRGEMDWIRVEVFDRAVSALSEA